MTGGGRVIPLVDLQAQYRSIKPEIDAAISRVLENAQFILGPAVSAFEADFAQFCGVAEAVGVSSGTSALIWPCWRPVSPRATR